MAWLHDAQTTGRLFCSVVERAGGACLVVLPLGRLIVCTSSTVVRLRLKGLTIGGCGFFRQGTTFRVREIASAKAEQSGKRNRNLYGINCGTFLQSGE